MEKAKICPVNNNVPDFTHAKSVMFNPTELSTTEKCAQRYYPKDSKQPGDIDDVNITITLFFNTYDNMWQSSYEDVRNKLKIFRDYQNLDNKTNSNYKEICFSWGSICIIGLLESLSIKYTMFTSDGTPVRAEATLTISGSYYGLESNYGVSRPDFASESDELNSALKAKESLRKGLLV